MGSTHGVCWEESFDYQGWKHLCYEGSTITVNAGLMFAMSGGNSITGIRIYYGRTQHPRGRYDTDINNQWRFVYKAITYDIAAGQVLKIPCTNEEFNCNPIWWHDPFCPKEESYCKQECRYEWIYASAKAVAGAMDHGDDSFVDSEAVANAFNANQVEGEAMNYEGHLFVDGVPFEPFSSTEPAVSAVSLSGEVSAGPSEITDIAAIVLIIVFLINLCCLLRIWARKCFKKGAAVAEYRKVQVMASEAEYKEEEEEQQML